MKVTGEYTFDAPRDLVWDALFDPEILASVMPGCEKLELVDENVYEGVLKIKVGPVQGKFNAKVTLSDIQAPDSYLMEVDGRGAPGFVKANAKVSLEGDDEKSVLKYDSDAKVGGRIATVGQRLLDSSAKAITKQSLDGLAKVIESRAAAEEGEEAPPIEAPSQAEFAANVAKEVAKDMV
ncbi:MAG: carbon monoxide dehydrogenase subunit G, partial [Holophagales bacterium]|nr:carbon monoxide dehydrogenase subunit G [Holophagales bacterium]